MATAIAETKTRIMTAKRQLGSAPVPAWPSGRRPFGKRAQARASRIRVLIADDHALVRQGLAAWVGRESDMTVVAEAHNGRRAVDLWMRHRPDVALIDLRMPDLDGPDCIREIRAHHASALLIVLTLFDDDEEIYRAMRAGARAYLLKDVSSEELAECIRRVYAGQTFVPPAIAAKLATRVAAPELTGRQTEVLRLLATGKSNKEISQELCISDSTVKSHLKGIFSKLNVLSRTEAVTIAGRRGLIRLS